MKMHPLVSFSWQRRGGELAMTAFDPLTNQSEVIEDLSAIESAARDGLAFGEESLWERRGWKLPLEYYVASLHVHDGVTIPPLNALPDVPLSAILERRRTCREFAGGAISRADLAAILEAAFADHLPPNLACHVIAMRVDGLEPGIYEWKQQLERVSPRSDGLEETLVDILIGQPYVIGSAAAIALSFETLTCTMRSWLIQCGALAQRLILHGHARGIDSFLSAAIREEAAQRLIGSTATPSHMVVFGRAAV